MPLPSPNENESKNDFVSRCLSNEQVQKDFGEGTEQAQAVCLRQWREAKGEDMNDEEFADKLHELKDVEIFRTGTWKGREFKESDLDEMVANFNQAGIRPPLKLGHRANSGDRAFGFISELKRKGDRLVANFSSVPEKVVDVIKEKGLDAVSSEIAFNLERNGSKFGKVLAGVALLGAELPAVSGLTPVSQSLQFGEEDETEEYLITYGAKLGSKLRELREGKQMTTAEVAEKLTSKLNEDVSPSTVAKVERGDIHTPGGPLIDAFASVFGVSSSSLKSMLEDQPPGKARVDQSEDRNNQEGEIMSKEYEELKQKLEEKDQQLQQLQEQVKQSDVTQYQEELEQYKKDLAKMQEQRRQETIDRKLEGLKVPALKEHVRLFYDYATLSTDTVKFSDETEKQPVEVVDELVKQLNDSTQWLFQEHSEHSDDYPGGSVGKSAGEQIHELTEKRMSEYSENYSDAYRHVLATNPELAKQYASE